MQQHRTVERCDLVTTDALGQRQAIIDANASAGADAISFAIPGAGVQTVTLATSLPAITDPVTIDVDETGRIVGLF